LKNADAFEISADHEEIAIGEYRKERDRRSERSELGEA
jgi:hypothetical protein